MRTIQRTLTAKQLLGLLRGEKVIISYDACEEIILVVEE